MEFSFLFFCLASPISNECLETFGASVVCFAMMQPTWSTWSKEGESFLGVRNGFSVCSERDTRGLNNGDDCRSMSDFFFFILSIFCLWCLCLSLRPGIPCYWIMGTQVGTSFDRISPPCSSLSLRNATAESWERTREFALYCSAHDQGVDSCWVRSHFSFD